MRVHSSFICNSPNCKQPECLPTDERINKLWYSYTMEYYLSNEKKSSTDTCNNDDEWKKLGKKKNTYHMNPLKITSKNAN